MPYSSVYSSTIDMLLVCIIGIVLLLLLGLLSFLTVKHMRESFVEKHAQAIIDQMHALNGTYRNSAGQKVPGRNTAVQRVKLRSKRQFDTYNAKKEFTNYVARFYTAFLQIPLPVWRAYALGKSDIVSNVPTLNVPWNLFWNNYSALVEIKDHVSAQSYINVRWDGRTHRHRDGIAALLRLVCKDVFELAAVDEASLDVDGGVGEAHGVAAPGREPAVDGCGGAGA